MFMENNRAVQSSLHLDKIIFDKIEFKRLGISSDNELELELQSNIAQKQNTEIYRVNLNLTGNKPDEYFFEISLTGFFTFIQDGDVTSELKESLITRNAPAILMPYLRSEVSILTAQPGLECVVLPVYNVSKIMSNN